MNVLLVSPYRGAIFESSGIVMQPLGVSYVGAALREAGHEVQIEILEDPTSLVDFSDADIVGISCSTVQYKPGLKVAMLAKEERKTVIMGGAHPTSSASDVLKTGYVDYVVRGEGELTAVELLEGLKQKGSFNPAKIPGVSWKDGESGSVRHNAPRPFIADLDRLPFPIREANWRKSGRIQAYNEIDCPVVTTRGCPYGCKFCDVRVIAGRKFRTRSVENTIKEIEFLVSTYGTKEVLVTDDIVNFDSERLIQICDGLIERNLPVMSWVMGRADHLLACPESAEKMARAGVRTMFLGIESPQRRVLNAYRKGGKSSSEVSERAVRLLKEHGIETWGAFMIGEPGETREDIQATLDYARYLNPGVGQFSILTPYPGTEIWDEFQGRIFTRDWDRYDAMHAVIRGDHVDPLEVEQLCRKAYRSFYLQPKRIAREVFLRRHVGRPSLRRIRQVLKALNAVFGDGLSQNSLQEGVRPVH
jgi:anaerobic magnesium-protoporphyrin IX monomethyl ester cyclase